jgi:hypothetical protein
VLVFLYEHVWCSVHTGSRSAQHQPADCERRNRHHEAPPVRSDEAGIRCYALHYFCDAATAEARDRRQREDGYAIGRQRI